MDYYKNKFKKILEQSDDEQLSPDQLTREDDVDAFNKSLDDDSSPDDFDTEFNRTSNIRLEYLKRFEEIITQFESFAEYLNGTEKDSINQFLNAIDKTGSIFSGVSKETGKITTVAESLRSISEAFRGFILTGRKKLRDQEEALAEYESF